MDIPTFRRSLLDAAPPAGLSLGLEGLWWDGKGDWDRAHKCAQKQDDSLGAAVHAYLHRKEGDLSNARYWYGRAGREPFAGALEAEWSALAGELLGL
jgi:hypothetical protein